MEILFEDEKILVAVKPQGVLSQSDEKGNESIVERLTAQTGQVIYPIHRLDRTTLGVMVFAKAPDAAKELSRQIVDHEMQKTYVAVVHGTVTPASGEMTDLLYFDRRKNKSFPVARERAGVKKAVLHYRTKQSAAEKTVAEILLQTGRTHQIRVQFASRGFPLLGDRRYGARDDYKEIALCARELSFFHPKTHEPMIFSMAETEAFSTFCERFGIEK